MLVCEPDYLTSVKQLPDQGSKDLGSKLRFKLVITSNLAVNANIPKQDSNSQTPKIQFQKMKSNVK